MRRPSTTSEMTPTSRRPASERVTGLTPRGAEDVADSAHRVHERRIEAVDLAPQVADVGLEHAGIGSEVVVPDVIKDLAPGQEADGGDEEVAEQSVCRCRRR